MAYTLEDIQRNSTFAMNFLVARGYTARQAAAIVGNLLAESNINPDTKAGDAGTAQGIAQWRLDRQTKFVEIMGEPIKGATLEGQLTFVCWELSNTHKKANTLLKEAQTIEAAVEAIDRFYERSAGFHLQKRIDLAKAQYELFTGSDLNNKIEVDTKIDRESEESMDASDPPAATQPGNTNEPVPSSSFPQPATQPQTFWARLWAWIVSLLK